MRELNSDYRSEMEAVTKEVIAQVQRVVASGRRLYASDPIECCDPGPTEGLSYDALVDLMIARLMPTEQDNRPYTHHDVPHANTKHRTMSAGIRQVRVTWPT